MARKPLLTEGEIRRFLKLARIGSVNDARISEYGAPTWQHDDEINEQEEELDVTDVEAEVGAEGGLEDLEVSDEVEVEDDLDLGEPDAAAGEDGAEDLVLSIVDDLQQLASLAGVDVEVDTGEEEVEGEEVVDVEDELAPVGDEGGLEDIEMASAEEEEVVPGGGGMRYENKAAVVDEVARRVVARLQQKQAIKAKEDMVNTIAERILSRMTK